MKIGIYTIHAHYNYGAMFQAYATQKALEKLGHEAELVNVYTKKEEFENEFRNFSLRPKQMLIYLYARFLFYLSICLNNLSFHFLYIIICQQLIV